MQVETTSSGPVPGNNEITRTAYQASQHKIRVKQRQQQESSADRYPPPIMGMTKATGREQMK